MKTRFAACILALVGFAVGARAQGCVCLARVNQQGVAQHECEDSDNCWLIGLPDETAQGGCFKARDVALLAPVSGDFKNQMVSEVVKALTKDAGLDVVVTFGGDVRISLKVSARPLQLVLADIRRLSGAEIKMAWLPQLGPTSRFSICINATALQAAQLLSVIGGVDIALPPGTEKRRVKLRMDRTDLAQVEKQIIQLLKSE